MDDPGAERDEILDYYIGLLDSSFEKRVDARAQLQQAITSKVSLETKDMLVRPVTAEEVKKTLWFINGETPRWV